MTPDQQQAALERAAAPALAAIDEDKGRAPQWLRPLFAAAAEPLFDADLSLERIQEAADLADPEVWTAFGEGVGRAPWTYLRDARLETAARLLLETEMSIAEAGYLVGYGSPPSFRRLLRGFLGMPPSRYRRRARRRLARAGPVPAGTETNAYWERMLSGELENGEALALDAYLGRLAPASAPAADEGEERWARLRRSLAEGVVETCVLDPEEGEEGAALPFAEQLRLVRDAVWFPDGSLFEAFSQRGAGQDPDRGVELALLAVASLAPNDLLETDPGLEALAWARLARARWRAGDRPGAREDLERSAHEAARAEGVPASWEAERSRVTAAFEWRAGRRQPALELAERAVTTQRAAGSGELAAALVLRAQLRAATADLEPRSAGARVGELRRALTDLEEAQTLAAAAPGAAGARPRHGQWEAGVRLRIRLLAQIGTRAEIAAALPALRRAVAGLRYGIALRLAWLEGHTAGAEAVWRQARDSFVEVDDGLWVARTTLDLARLCLAEERPGEATALASELATALEATATDPGDPATLEPLRRAAPFTEVTSGDLEAAESVLKRLEWQRRAARALDLAM